MCLGFSKSGSSEKYVIDRFEGDVAVLEKQSDGSIKNVKKSTLSPSAKEGDVIMHSENHVSFDSAESRKKRQQNKNLQDEIFGKR